MTSRIRHWWHRVRHPSGHRLFCTCQVIGFVWYADGQVWTLHPDDVEVISGD